MCIRRSKPLIAGIWTSAMTQDESFRQLDCKNSSADANVWTWYPCELRRLSVAVRTDASSSTTEITESMDKAGLPETGARGARISTTPAKSGPSISFVKPYLSLHDKDVMRWHEPLCLLNEVWACFISRP